MPIIFERKSSHPGTHALVIGVSRYPHVAGGREPTDRGTSMEIGQLTSAARSASEFAAWLVDAYHNPEAPLASLRLLVSPSEGETLAPRVRPLVKGKDCSATTAHVECDVVDFREACDTDRANVAIVYIAGHGVQFTKSGAIVLLEDFGNRREPTLLSSAVNVVSLFDGINHAKGAHIQFWFLDACRQRPEVAQAFEHVEKARISLDARPGNADSASLVFASQTRESALARTGQISLFMDALLWALQGGASEGATKELGEWHVSAARLFTVLKERVSSLAHAFDQEQHVEIAQWVGTNATIQRFTEPPPVRLRIDLEPPQREPSPKCSLFCSSGTPVVEDCSRWPLERTVRPGLYRLRIDPEPPLKPYEDILDVAPLEHTETVELKP